MKTSILFVFIFFFSSGVLLAQDIHFSQFYNSPMNLNPALTGVFKGDLRFVGNYRSQWQSVPVPYLTFSGGFDQKIYQPWLGNGVLGGGLLFNYDKAGDGDFSLTQLGLNLAYTLPLSDELFLSAGFQVALGQRRVEPAKLTFGEQWNGDLFDPTRSNTEAFNQTSFGMFSLSGGFNLHYQIEDTRTKFDAGLGYYHLNQPTYSFFEDADVVLPLRGNNYAIATVQVQEKIDVRVHALYTFQALEGFAAEAFETVAGLGLRYHLRTEKDQELAVQPGISFRVGDAIIPTFEVIYRAWQVGVSYDVTISDFTEATVRRGGPEFSIQYIITNVKPPEVFKACPIF